MNLTDRMDGSQGNPGVIRLNVLPAVTAAAMFLLIALIIPVTAGLAQYKDVKVTITADRLQGQEKSDLAILQGAIEQYFEYYNWIDDPYGISIIMTIHISAEGVNTTGFERIYSSRMFISNAAQDMKFYDKSCSFVYNTNDPLVHSDMYHSLTSLLDFWSYCMIGHEMDTYDILAGTAAYEKARSIALRTKNERGAQNWDNRLQTLEEIVENRPYREMKSDYYYALYLIDEGKTKQGIRAMSSALNNLENVFSINNREKWTRMFLDAHAKEWMQYLKKINARDLQEKLKKLDPDRVKLYNDVLSSG